PGEAGSVLGRQRALRTGRAPARAAGRGLDGAAGRLHRPRPPPCGNPGTGLLVLRRPEPDQLPGVPAPPPPVLAVGPGPALLAAAGLPRLRAPHLAGRLLALLSGAGSPAPVRAVDDRQKNGSE